jgi:MscS family membrane protein
LSEVSPDRLRVAATEAGLLLYEVLNRAGLPDSSEIPGEEEVEGNELQSWKVPRTEITLIRVDEGDRIGEFLFSPQTVARALEFYEKVKHLPYKTDYAQGTYEEYVTRPDFSIPYRWADELPSWAKVRFFRNPVWKLVVVLITLCLGIFFAVLVRRVGRWWDAKFGQRGGPWRVGTLAFAMSLVAIPIVLARFLGNIIGVRFEVQAVISKGLFTLAFVAAVYAVFALFEFIAEVIVSSRYLSEKSFNAPLVRVTSRLFGILASIFIIVRAAEYLGIQVGPVLAGLGIGGLAVALAARPTLENIIGGFTLFADKPVRVGDFCHFGDEEGIVEEIGLRSTRIRKRNDVLVTVPNADFSQMQLENSARILQRVYHETLGLRYETTPDQLRYVLAKLREMLIGHPKVSPYRLHVRFRGFGAYSLDVEVYARTHTCMPLVL